jgi:cell division protein FtsI/penicillin-binding protein 2
MISCIATGKEVHPRLINTLSIDKNIDIDVKYLEIIRKALIEARTIGAIKNFVHPKYKVVGKTGTSQVISKSFH